MKTNGMLFREALGHSIREERTEQLLTLRSLSQRATIALGYLSELERGQKEASSEIVATIAAGLGMPTWELVLRAAHLMAGAEIQVPDTIESLLVDQP
jgi:transcriptional regulator with XRE-family HTH domain